MQAAVLMANPGVAHPASVDWRLRADKLQKGRLALGIGLQSTPQGRDDLRWLRHILSMITLRSGLCAWRSIAVRHYHCDVITVIVWRA